MEGLLLLYIIGGIMGICFTAWLFSIFFRVKDQIWYKQKTLDILIEMAKKTGVSQEEIYDILSRKVK